MGNSRWNEAVKWIEYGVRRCGSTAKPRLEVSAVGVNGNVTDPGTGKNGANDGNPLQPLELHDPENRGAVASENCWEPSIKAVAMPGEPF